MTRARHPVTAFLLTLTCVVLATTSVLAEVPKRYALVIGNSDYHNAGQVPHAARDAAQIAQSLSELRFQVIAGFNVDRQGFEQLVAQLGQQAADAGAETVVIYYAGHGFQLAGRNHLVPVDAVLRDRSGEEAETLVLDDILASVHSPLRRTIVFLDACRGSSGQPMMQPGDAGHGLARVQIGESTFVAFAAEPGSDGCDGASGSPFADALLTHIGKPNLSLADLMTGVREEVSGRTLGRQMPWAQSSLRGDFSFNPLEPYRVASTQADDLPVAGRGTEPGSSDRTAKSLVIGAAAGQEMEGSKVAPTLKRLLPVNSQRIGADASTAAATSQETEQSQLAALDPTLSPDTTFGTPQAAADNSAADNLALATPPEPRVKPEVQATQDDLIRPIQEKLRKIGCYKGAVDGQWGPQSRSAVKRYQGAKGRAVRSLEPAQDLLASLEGESKTVCAPAKRTATAKKTKTPTKQPAKTRQARAATPPPQHWEPSPPPVAPTFHIGPHGGINLGFGF